MNPQPSCQDLADFITQKTQAVGKNGTVSCTDSKSIAKK
jgi:hypothetical protein